MHTSILSYLLYTSETDDNHRQLADLTHTLITLCCHIHFGAPPSTPPNIYVIILYLEELLFLSLTHDCKTVDQLLQNHCQFILSLLIYKSHKIVKFMNCLRFQIVTNQFFYPLLKKDKRMQEPILSTFARRSITVCFTNIIFQYIITKTVDSPEGTL